MNEKSPNNRAARLKLLGLALVFFAPLALAWILYFGFPQSAPDERTNRGHLVDPARPLPAIGLRTPDGEAAGRAVFEDHWTMLYVNAGACGDVCQKRLYDTRQVWASLHRRMPRVRRLYVALDALPPGGVSGLTDIEHRDLRAYTASDRRLAEFLEETLAEVGNNGAVYIFDPLGNLVLYYTPDDPAKGMLKDLKHLLRVSRIG